MIKAIESVISPCNATYREHRERAAERVLSIIEENDMLYEWEEEDEKDSDL